MELCCAGLRLLIILHYGFTCWWFSTLIYWSFGLYINLKTVRQVVTEPSDASWCLLLWIIQTVRSLMIIYMVEKFILWLNFRTDAQLWRCVRCVSGVCQVCQVCVRCVRCVSVLQVDTFRLFPVLKCWRGAWPLCPVSTPWSVSGWAGSAGAAAAEPSGATTSWCRRMRTASSPRSWHLK